MNKKKILYFHIGYPKTASSLLQRYFFCNNNKINYLGIPLKKNWGADEWILYEFLLFLFSASKKDYYENFKKHIHKFKSIKFNQDQINLISHDSLTNTIYLENFDIYETLNRIHNFFEVNLGYKVKIVFSIRKQTNIISSYYAQFYRKLFKINYKWKKFKEFVYYLSSINKNIKNNINEKQNKIFNSFFYFSYYQFLEKKFGKENIKILLYEDLLFQPDFFFKELSSFLNTEIKSYEKIIRENENQSSFIETNEYERKYVLIYKSFSKYIKNKKIKKFFYRLATKDKVILSSNQDKLIKDYYYKENYHLNKILNNRLQKYNYFDNI